MLVLKWSWYSLTRHAQLCLFVTPWPVAPQTPLFMGFSRQEYWSRLPFFPPGDIRVSCVSYTAGRFFTAEQLGKPKVVVKYCFSFCHWESLKYIIHLLKFILKVTVISSVQSLSCVQLCNSMDCSMPGFPVHHQLPELTQTHVHQVVWCHPTISSSVFPFSSCLQSFPASGSFQMSQFFASGGKVLEFQLQHHSFQWIFRTDFL